MMRKTYFLPILLLLPATAQSQQFGGLFAFEEAPVAISAPEPAPLQPVQQQLQGVPSLDGPFSGALPGMAELDARDSQIKPEELRAAQIPPVRPVMSPLRGAVGSPASARSPSASRKIYRRSFDNGPAAIGAAEGSVASGRSLVASGGEPTPLIPGWRATPARR